MKAQGAADTGLVAAGASLDAAEPGTQSDTRLVARGWMRIGIAAVVAAQAMVFSLAVNLTPPDTAAGYWLAHGGLIMAATLTLVFLGGDLVSAAWATLRAGKLGIDLLFLVTLLGAFAGSLVSTITHTGSVYYEVVAVLVVVHTTGRLLGARSRLAALRAVDETRERFDACRVRRADGEIETVPVATLRGDEVVVLGPGEAVAVDGRIIAGRSFLEETALTGEWAPVARGPGDRVLAGTHVVDGLLEVRPGTGPRELDRILGEVAAARFAPSHLQEQADRLTRWFLPVVIGVAVAAFLLWWRAAPWDRALFNAMAVLLVACPCAAGLATPIAVWGGLVRLARLGIVARTGDVIDALSRADVVCLDKTGTLSTAELAVREWRTTEDWSAPEQAAWLRAVVASVESPLEHPVARALTTAATTASDGQSLPPVEVSYIVPVAGQGVQAVARRLDGGVCEVRIGTRGWAMRETSGAMLSREDAESANPYGAGAAKRVAISVDGALAAEVLLGEHWRPGLDEALAQLAALGVAVEVLTGDPEPPPLPAGVPVRAGLRPDDKTARVSELVAAGHSVVLVGDGVNDAAAMGAAALGIAVRGGSDLARAAAQAVLVGDDLRALPSAVELARDVRQRIRSNLSFAVGYNVAGMALAAAGVLHPVVAALLMVGSSLFVGVRAARGAGGDLGSTTGLSPRRLPLPADDAA